MTFLLNPIGWFLSNGDVFVDMDVVGGLEKLVSTLVKENNMRQLENLLTKVIIEIYNSSARG